MVEAVPLDEEALYPQVPSVVTFPVLIHRAAITVYAGNIRNATPKALWVLRQVSQLSGMRETQDSFTDIDHMVGVRSRLPPIPVDGLETCDVAGQRGSFGTGLSIIKISQVDGILRRFGRT